MEYYARYKSSRTGNVTVVNYTEYSYKFLYPMIKIIREVTKDLNLDPKKIKIFLKCDLPFSYGAGSCKEKKDRSGYFVIINPEAFIYEIDDTTLLLDTKKAKEIIAHELRHVWQFTTGIIKHIFDNKFSWKGKIYENFAVDIASRDSSSFDYYWNLPWEKDAREYSGDLER